MSRTPKYTPQSTKLTSLSGPIRPTGDEWYNAAYENSGMFKDISLAVASFWVDLRNTDTNQRTVNDVYVELWSEGMCWPWKRFIVRIEPEIVDSDTNWRKGHPIRTRVDWVLAPASSTYSHRLHVWRSWKGAPKLPSCISSRRLAVETISGAGI